MQIISEEVPFTVRKILFYMQFYNPSQTPPPPPPPPPPPLKEEEEEEEEEAACTHLYAESQ